MTNEHVCSLCGRSSPTAVCAWCGMLSDVGAAVEEARIVSSGDGADSTASRAHVGTRTTVVHPAHAVSIIQRQEAAVSTADRESLPSGSGDSGNAGVIRDRDGFEPGARDIPEPPAGMCVVPAGIFQFGEAGQPRYLTDFFIDAYPVTNQEYAEFVEETGHRLPRFWVGGQPPAGKADHPVVGITQEDAKTFARWVGKQLPSEEEWEKAARGSDGRSYPWGEMFLPSKANVSGSGIKDTSSVRRFPEGKSPFGCLDMAGNVWEWTATPFQAGGVNCTLKGGSWYDFSTHARCVSRFSAPPDYEGNSVGFRCVVRPGDSSERPERPVRPGRRSVGSEYDRDRFRTAGSAAAASGPTPPRNNGHPGPAGSDGPGAGAGPLRDLVDTAVNVLDRFSPQAVQARMDEILEEPLVGTGDPEIIPPPEVEPEDEVPLPEGRWWRWLRPLARGLWTLLPWGNRVARGLDLFFKRTPRWISALAILVIPLAAAGLILLSSILEEPGGADARGDTDSPAAVRPTQARPATRPRARPGRPTVPRREARASSPGPARASGTAPIGSAPESSPAADAGEASGSACAPPPGMVLIPAGPCVVGRDSRQLRLPGFFLDRYEVTNLAYQRFVTKTRYPAPLHWKQGKIPPGLENHPVVNVDHADARAYARWAGKRLPTEEEWEKAARGPEGRIYPWGDTPDTSRANLFHPAAQGLGTRAVGSFAQGVSPYGCHDMAGNVLEWTDSRMGENFVLKGGSWGLSREGGACHFRYVFFPAETRTPMVGFRCARDLSDGRTNAAPPIANR